MKDRTKTSAKFNLGPKPSKNTDTCFSEKTKAAMYGKPAMCGPKHGPKMMINTNDLPAGAKKLVEGVANKYK